MLELTLRLVFSLAVVLGLLLLLAKFGARRFRGQHGALVRVLHRQPLTRGTSVSVVAVGSRILVLGTTEQQIRVLTELDPDEVGEPLRLDTEAAHPQAEIAAAPDRAPTLVPAPGTSKTPGAVSTHGPLAGSVLSADTWRQALTAATRRVS